MAIQAGLNTQHIYIDDIGWSEDLEIFCDLDNQIIRHLFKLYPWEWMMGENFVNKRREYPEHYSPVMGNVMFR